LALAFADYSTALSLLREAELIWLAVDPRFNPLRDNSDFLRVIETVMGTPVI
jgi:hypothetical protein